MESKLILKTGWKIKDFRMFEGIFIVMFEDEDGDATMPYKLIPIECKELTRWEKIKWFFKKKKLLTETRLWYYGK